jgi:hypothetical protein
VLHGRRVVPARLEACWAPVDSMAVSRQYGFAVESGHGIGHWSRAIVASRVVERGSHEPGGAFRWQRSAKYKAEERKKRCQAQRSGRRFRSSCCSRELKRQLLLAPVLSPELVHCNFSFSPSSQELRPAAKNLQGCGPCISHQRRVLVAIRSLACNIMMYPLQTSELRTLPPLRPSQYYTQTSNWQITLHVASGRLDVDLHSVFYTQHRHLQVKQCRCALALV